MMLILLLSMLLLGPHSYANTKVASKKSLSSKQAKKQVMSPGARRAQEYFKHDDDYGLTMRVVEAPKAKMSAIKNKKRKLASQTKVSKNTKTPKKKLAQSKNKKSDSKQRRLLASKGIPRKLPAKKI